MERLMARLAPGARRYVAKSTGTGRDRRWGVYDIAMASYPGNGPVTGPVKQKLKTEAEAQVEADRIQKIYEESLT